MVEVRRARAPPPPSRTHTPTSSKWMKKMAQLALNALQVSDDPFNWLFLFPPPFSFKKQNTTDSFFFTDGIVATMNLKVPSSVASSS